MESRPPFADGFFVFILTRSPQRVYKKSPRVGGGCGFGKTPSRRLMPIRSGLGRKGEFDGRKEEWMTGKMEAR
jgi:hypothetical protein